MQIQGQAALITGGASGLGEATARELARLGAKVAVPDRNAELAAKVAQAINTAFGDGRAVACACDITDTASVTAAIDKADAAHGPAHILMNVAGNWQRQTHRAARWQRRAAGRLCARNQHQPDRQLQHEPPFCRCVRPAARAGQRRTRRDDVHRVGGSV